MTKDSRKISKDEILKIAEQAMIMLTENEVEKFQREITSILEYVEILEKVDTSKVKTTPHTPLSNIMRDDIIRPSLSQNDALSNRPKQKSTGYFHISSVVDSKK